MAGWKRRILGISVISAGVCAALPFRNDMANSPVATPEKATMSRSYASGNELTLQLTIPIDPGTLPIADREPEVTPAVLKAAPSLQAQEVRRDDLQAPPQLASTFETFVGTAPVTLETSVSSTKTDQPERRHRIADGDTLESIAKRYLGTRNEWRSIYSYNEDLLTDPAVLPIGKEIKIPAKAANSYDDDRLVPIPPELLKRD